MNKFKVVATLRNGKEISGIYETGSKRRTKAATELLKGSAEENGISVSCLMSQDGTEIYFKSEDISALKIKPYQVEGE